MVPARKNDWFAAAFTRHAASRLRKSFGAVLIRGHVEARALSKQAPIVIVSNHVSWWDALVALVIANQVLGADGFALMDQANLERLPFFGLAGAVGVDRSSALDGARVVRHAASLLDRPTRLVWVFAQGMERASTVVPLGFERGAAAIAKLSPAARVVPVALRYEPGPMASPMLLVDIGAPLDGDASAELAAATRAQESAVEALLARSGASLAAGDLSPYETWWRARPQALQTFLERLLATVTKPWVLGGTKRHSSRS